MSKEAIVDKFESLRSGAARQKAIGLSILALAGGAIAGCGSNEANVEATPPPLTKTEFVEKANELCAEAVEKANEQEESFEEDLSARDFSVGSETREDAWNTAANATIVPTLQELHDNLTALTPPVADEQEVGPMLSSLQNAIEETKTDPYGLLVDNIEVIDNAEGPIEEINHSPYIEYAAMAEAYGLGDECMLTERDPVPITPDEDYDGLVP